MFDLVWFDSFGAKSSCIFLKTNKKIIIDPGISVMHPSFPASEEKKLEWYKKGFEEILRFFKKSEIVIITHYHWDHFLREYELYKGKIIFAKNPNEYINDKQRERALDFFRNLFGVLDEKFDLKEPEEKEYEIPKLESFERDFGEYNKRRKELLEKGERWFLRRVERWKRYKRIPEIKGKIIFPEGKEFRFGKTKLIFSDPMFHGIEFSRTGWVFSVLIKYKDEKLFYSSDLNGPIIEDYTDFIIDLDPDYIILDGPPTYLIPYTMNLINLRRVIENVKRIVDEADFKLLVWDHHLPRERNFRKRTKEVWEYAKEKGKLIFTAREYKFNKKPVVEEL